MKKAWILGLIVAGAGAATAATLGLSTGLDVSPTSPTIAVVSGTTTVAAIPMIAAQTPVPISATCIALTASAGTTEPAPGTTGCGFTSHVTLQDRV